MKESNYGVWFAISCLTILIFVLFFFINVVKFVDRVNVIQSDLDNLVDNSPCWLIENGKYIGVGKIDGSCEAWERISEINNKFIDRKGIGATGVRQYKVVDTSYVTVQESDIPKEYRDSLKGK